MENDELIQIEVTEDIYEALASIAEEEGSDVETVASRIINQELAKIVNDPEYAKAVMEQVKEMGEQ